jgi:hypothetical protein
MISFTCGHDLAFTCIDLEEEKRYNNAKMLNHNLLCVNGMIIWSWVWMLWIKDVQYLGSGAAKIGFIVKSILAAR